MKSRALKFLVGAVPLSMAMVVLNGCSRSESAAEKSETREIHGEPINAPKAVAVTGMQPQKTETPTITESKVVPITEIKTVPATPVQTKATPVPVQASAVSLPEKREIILR